MKISQNEAIRQSYMWLKIGEPKQLSTYLTGSWKMGSESKILRFGIHSMTQMKELCHP